MFLWEALVDENENIEMLDEMSDLTESQNEEEIKESVELELPEQERGKYEKAQRYSSMKNIVNKSVRKLPKLMLNASVRMSLHIARQVNA